MPTPSPLRWPHHPTADVQGISELLLASREETLRLVVVQALRRCSIIRDREGGIGMVLRGSHPAFVRRYRWLGFIFWAYSPNPDGLDYIALYDLIVLRRCYFTCSNPIADCASLKPGGPAEKAGICLGDQIWEVEGGSVRHLTHESVSVKVLF